MKRLIITSICSMALLAGGLLTATPAWAQPQRVSGMRGQDRRESAADNRASISRPAASNNAGRRPSITTGGEGRQQRPMVSNGYTPVAGNRNREVHSGIDHGVNTGRSNGGDMRSRYPNFGNSNNRPNGRPGDNYGDHNRPGKRPGDNYGNHNRPGNNYGNHGHGYYDRYRYHHGYRPRDGRRDHMFVRYSHGWARPWRPAPRPWHHSMWWYRRPVIPVGFTPLSGCPIIDGIIGLYFGTAYDASLNFLYYNGYNIGGYYNNVIYLNDVDLYGYRWPGVMLNYDPVTGLNYAQFSYYTTYSDPYRYNRLYRSLCDAYGRPVQVVSGSYPQVTWLGGDGRGYVTLSQNFTNGRFFTAISFGY